MIEFVMVLISIGMALHMGARIIDLFSDDYNYRRSDEVAGFLSVVVALGFVALLGLVLWMLGSLVVAVGAMIDWSLVVARLSSVVEFVAWSLFGAFALALVCAFIAYISERVVDFRDQLRDARHRELVDAFAEVLGRSTVRSDLRVTNFGDLAGAVSDLIRTEVQRELEFRATVQAKLAASKLPIDEGKLPIYQDDLTFEVFCPFCTAYSPPGALYCVSCSQPVPHVSTGDTTRLHNDDTYFLGV